MAASSEFIAFIIEQMAGFGAVTTRRMFSGAGFYRGGVMFALVARDTLYFKCDQAAAPDFDALELGPFTYATKKGQTTIASFRRAPASCLDDPDELAAWCRKSFAAAMRLAPQQPRRRRRTLSSSGR